MIIRITKAFKNFHLVKKINALEIASSGIDSDMDPFVVLKDGTKFFGNHHIPSTPTLLYYLLSGETRRVLKKQCLQVAIDITIRYYGQALKAGGPKKTRNYHVKAGDKVSEMGSYQGFYSMKLAHEVGSTGTVIAIESMPDNYRLLAKNKAENQLNQMIVVNSGVWDSPAQLTFSRRPGDHQSSSISLTYSSKEEFNIDVDSLDNIYSDLGVYPEDFIIIQLNGAELKALQGLTKFKPSHLSIAARYDTDGVRAPEAIQDLLVSRGYEVEIVDNDFVFARLVS